MRCEGGVRECVRHFIVDVCLSGSAVVTVRGLQHRGDQPGQSDSQTPADREVSGGNIPGHGPLGGPGQES